MSSTDWLLGLENFIEIFSYIPGDIASYILVLTSVLLVLAIRRVLY